MPLGGYRGAEITVRKDPREFGLGTTIHWSLPRIPL